MTERERYDHEIEEIENDARIIETASDYTTDYIKHGSACDSSSRKTKRMSFVLHAQGLVIAKYKSEILQLAAKLCRESKGV